MHKRNKHGSGFTIVELLIVIVVIAILAAISVVAYTGIQNRANNSATISAASGSLKLIQAYIAQQGSYPSTHTTNQVYFCLTTESGCTNAAGTTLPNATSTFNSNMGEVGVIPKRAPVAATQSGVLYFYHGNTINLDGQFQSAWLVYWLNGTNQNCGLPGVLTTSSPMTASPNSYSNGNDSNMGKTRCNILIPGPAHS